MATCCDPYVSEGLPYEPVLHMFTQSLHITSLTILAEFNQKSFIGMVRAQCKQPDYMQLQLILPILQLCRIPLERNDTGMASTSPLCDYICVVFGSKSANSTNRLLIDVTRAASVPVANVQCIEKHSEYGGNTQVHTMSLCGMAERPYTS